MDGNGARKRGQRSEDGVAGPLGFETIFTLIVVTASAAVAGAPSVAMDSTVAQIASPDGVTYLDQRMMMGRD